MTLYIDDTEYTFYIMLLQKNKKLIFSFCLHI